MINQALIHQLSKVICRPDFEELINEMDWKNVYRKLEAEIVKGLDSNAIGAFTRMLLDCNINPLDTLVDIPPRYLRYDSKITKLNIPSQVRRINSHAFEGCENLAEVSFSEGLIELGRFVFGDTKISSLYLPDSLQRLNSLSLVSMENLSEISLGPNVKGIDSETFGGDLSLTEIQYRGTKAQWSAALVPGFTEFWQSPIGIVRCTDGEVYYL